MGGASECIKSYSEALFKGKLKICWNYFQAERLIYKNTRDHKLNSKKICLCFVCCRL